MSHTPGPWMNDDGIIFPPDDCDGQCWVADVRSATNPIANARLIAAAPDLLAALEMARDAISTFPRSLAYDLTHLPEINAAIAKATGK